MTGDGLRAWKQSGAGPKTFFLYAGDRLAMEEDAQGNVTAAYGWGADGLRQRFAPLTGVNTFYTYDPSGNLAQRVQSVPYQGTTAARYPDNVDTAVYDGFGQVLGDIDTGTAQAETYQDPVGFGGQFGYYTDAETGLVCLTHRYYDGKTGRFVNRDPIGYRGGINLYGFMGRASRRGTLPRLTVAGHSNSSSMS